MANIAALLSVVCILALSGFTFNGVDAHARIADPPQRGSLWRHSEFDWANPGRQADDHENFCGGRGVTTPYLGACGVCGDSILDPKPRKHEIGGEYERGIITRNYTAGQTIPIEIAIAAGHGGWHEFRLCAYSVFGEETQECFDQNLLRYSDGKTRHDIAGRENIVLPAGVTCERCVMQWHWYGEGSNQYYRNCVDISIH